MTTSPVPTAAPITSAAAADAESAIAVLTLAFSADAANRWVWPDPSHYLSSFPAFVRAFAGGAFEQGTAHRNAGDAGVALWLPPGVHADEDALAILLQNTVAEEVRDDLMAVLDQMCGYHPTEPHWYLPLIGVDPARRGQGYGSQLLRHALAACDRDGTPAYLESSNAANIPLYERHGFEVLGTIQVGTSPPLFPMLRSAR
jgi:ribosomal protein S18 acetylase RimI-like enzyme